MLAKRLICLVATLLVTNVAFSQLRFDSLTHDFGTIGEADGKVQCTFRALNSGAKPLIIRNIATSCGCTVPEFGRAPILPGDSTTIKITYDPYGRPGHFDRKLYVWGTGEKPLAVLSIRGAVTPRPKSVEERYPIEAGEGIRLSATHCAYTYIYVGAEMQSAIGVVNTSSRPRTLHLEPLVESGLMRLHYPATLQPNVAESINFAYLNPASQPRYGTINDSYRLFVDGQPTQIVLMAHGIGVDRVTKSTEDAAPKVHTSENIIKFGAVKRANGPFVRRFWVTNSGEGELKIRAVECSKAVSTTLRAGATLAAGERLEGEVTLTIAPTEAGFISEHLSLVTNDAARPLRRIRVTAIVEE